MKTINEELFSKWIDNCLTPAEQEQVDAAAKEDPSLLKEVESLRGLGSQLKDHLPVSQEPPYPDFFNTQVMNKIAKMEKNEEAPASVPSAPWWAKLRWGWVPASALAMVLAFFAGTKIHRPTSSESFTQIGLPSVYTAQDSHEAQIIANEDGEVAVIVMQGLDAIGDDVDFVTADATTALPERFLIAQKRNHF